jgi:hypothetical protein
MKSKFAANSVRNSAALAAFCIAFLGLTVIGFTQDAKKPTYEQIVESAKRGDPNIDFAALRFAFLDSSSEHKDGFFNAKLLNGLNQQKDYQKLLDTANGFIAQDFVDIRSHFAAATAYKALGHDAEFQKELAIAKGLMQSILDSGDGKSQKTAYVVINTSEEYAVLEFLGIRASGQQSLILGHTNQTSGGPAFDVLKAAKNGQDMDIYFDIAKFYGKEHQQQPAH